MRGGGRRESGDKKKVCGFHPDMWVALPHHPKPLSKLMRTKNEQIGYIREVRYMILRMGDENHT